ncbi:MAG: hypothetical protein Ct9H90mP25_3220 [Gammaproteobacteria bacterium]|nr:MAG: hypothetical protein Ct9H90mP25_3220 [Gammaproteobacteria bacterium]
MACIFTGMLLSLAGIPLTVGFIGKFYVFFAGVESELWGLLLVLVIGSGIGLYYYLRIVYTMLLSSNDNENSNSGIISKKFCDSRCISSDISTAFIIWGLPCTAYVSCGINFVFYPVAIDTV